MSSGSRPAEGTVVSVRVLFEKSGGDRYGLTLQAFELVLEQVADKYLPGATIRQKHEFWQGLKLEELALARGCAAGHESAWQAFLTRFREKLYDIARGITKEDSSARDLADSLYADLYGTSERDGRRVSRLNFYMGRGSLEGWLRTVLAQEFVNRYRKQKRLVSLEEQAEDGVQFSAAPAGPTSPLDSRLGAALDEALALRISDHRNLRVGKGDRRDRAVVGPGAAAGDVSGGHARLVLADVGEQRDAGAVADRPDALRCFEALVRLDSALRDLHAELLEAETFGVGLAAGRDQ